MKKRLEYLKRGLCIFLAGTMILSSDITGFAAELPQNISADSSEMASDVSAPDMQAEVQTSAESGAGDEAGASDAVNPLDEVPDNQASADNAEAANGVQDEVPADVPQDTVAVSGGQDEVPADGEQDSKSVVGDENTRAGELADANPRINFANGKNYLMAEVGQTVSLPEYTITYLEATYTPTTPPQMKWESDDMGVASLNAQAGTVTALKPGVAYLQLKFVDEPDIHATYQIVVRPSAPNTASVTATTNQSISLSWAEAADAEGYVVYRKAEKDTDYKELARFKGAVTSYTDSDNLQIGTTYAYRIYSYIFYKDEKGMTQYAESTERAILTSALALGTVNFISAVSAGSNTAALTWELLPGAAGYTIYRAASGSSDYQEVATVDANISSYTDTGLSAGYGYNYKIAAYSIVDGAKIYGKESAVLTVKPVPATPQLVIASSGYKSVKLSWNQIDGVSGYCVYRKAGNAASFKKIATLGGSTKVTYTDKDVKTGTTYTYKIRAYQTVGSAKTWGAYSAEQSAKPTLNAPQITLSKPLYSSVTVSWNKVSGANGYKVYRAASATGKYSLIKTVNSTSTLSYTDADLTLGKTYYYKVCAYRNVNGSKVNGTKSEAQFTQIVPAAPTVKTEAAGATAIKLTWEKVELPSKNSGYYVYQVVDGTDVKLKKCSAKKDSYTVTNLLPGNNYSFKVAAYVTNSNGETLLGDFSKTITASPKLLPVTIDSVTAAGYQKLSVNWKATQAADEDAYDVYRAASKKGKYTKVGTVAKEAGKTDYSFVDNNVTVGKKYYYKIKCTKTLADARVIESGYSKAKSGIGAPSAPKIKVTGNQYNSLKISWKKVKGNTSSGYVNGYTIYRSTEKNGTYKKIKKIDSGRTTSYIDEGLTTGTKYYYKVRAYCTVNKKAVYGEYSVVASGKPVPQTPVIEAKTTDYQTVTVSWKSVAGSDGYRIYRSETADGTYKLVKTVGSAKTSYKNKKLTTGKEYYYKVRAYCNKNGKKVFSQYSEVKSAIPVLNKPTNLKAVVENDNQIKLTWDAVAGAKTYTVLRSTSLTGSYKVATEICNTNSYIDTNVTNGKTYYYKIYAVRGNAVSETTDPVMALAVSLKLSVSEVVVKTGTQVKVSAVTKPSSTVMWTSANTSVALVTSEGVVYGLKAGTTTLTATANGVTKSVPVTVKDKLDGKGIEVSASNGTVDFDAVKASGYEYVMLRISSGTTKDKNFETNYTKAKAAGLKIGVSCYAKARTKAEAEKEAYQVLSLLTGHTIDYPIVYDMQEITLLYGLTNTERSDMVEGFKNVIVNVGKQKFILCASQEWLTKYLDNTRLAGTDLWIRNYRDLSLGHGYAGAGYVVMWGYTDKGAVSGVDGNANISISYMGY